MGKDVFMLLDPVQATVVQLAEFACVFTEGYPQSSQL